MADEDVYRIEIPIVVEDKTTQGLNQAQQKLTKFEQSAAKTEQQLQRMNKTRWQLFLSAIDKATPVVNSVISKARSLAGKTYRLTIKAVDLATSPIRAIVRSATSLTGMLGMGAGAAGGLIYPLKLAGDMEQANIAFETMLGSAAKAQKFIADLSTFAAKTPFEFPQLQQASKMLLAFKFDADQILPMMTAIGNAASGLSLGAEGIQRLILAIGQMKAKGKVQGDEMLQLTSAGVPAWQMLADSMGKSTAEVQKMSEQGLIPADQAIKALIDGMNKSFPNMMDKQSRSLTGLLSTIKDMFNLNIVTAWGDGLRQGIEPRLQKLVDWFDKNEKAVGAWKDTLTQAGKAASNFVLDKVESAQKKLADLAGTDEFKNAGVFGKLQLAWDKVVQEPFDQWWSSGGGKFVTDASSKIGGAIGGGLGSFMRAALGIAADSGQANQNPFVKAGEEAGSAFFKAFIAEFNPSMLAEKATSAFTQSNGKMVTGQGSTVGSIATAALDAFLLSKGIKYGGKLFKGGKTAGSELSKAWGWFKGVSGMNAPGWEALGSAGTAEAGTAASAAKAVEILGPSGQVLSKVGQQEVTRASETAMKAAATSLAKSGASNLLKYGGKALGRLAIPLALAGDAYSIASAKTATERGAAIGGSAGGWGGAAAGAAAGAALGSVVPVLGTAVGGVIGGILGGLGGGILGNWAGGKIGASMESDGSNMSSGIRDPLDGGNSSKSSTPPVIQVTIQNVSSQYDITTAASADDVMKVIMDNQRSIADALADEISKVLEDINSNTGAYTFDFSMIG